MFSPPGLRVSFPTAKRGEENTVCGGCAVHLGSSGWGTNGSTRLGNWSFKRPNPEHSLSSTIAVFLGKRPFRALLHAAFPYRQSAGEKRWLLLKDFLACAATLCLNPATLFFLFLTECVQEKHSGRQPKRPAVSYLAPRSGEGHYQEKTKPGLVLGTPCSQPACRY